MDQHLPKTRFAPTRVARDTYVIHEHHGEGEAPVSVGFNTLVIRGAEPVVVDTGMVEFGEQYFEDLFGLVEPTDIRWVFISHDDHDHTGNVNALMEQAPNATVVVNWFMTERMGASLDVPVTRQRWLGDGETLDVGDRRLLAVRPPIFDAPTTRGLFDPTTGVYWASDSFATPMTTPVTNVAELDPTFWAEGMATFDNYVAAWLPLVDDTRFQRTVDRVEQLAPAVLVGCHTPVIDGANVATALAATRRSPSASFPAQPDQAVLETIQQALAAPAAA